MTTTHVPSGLRGPSVVAQLARQTAGELRRGARRRNEHEQRLAVLGLLHDDPVLLVETVLRLARAAPDYTAAEVRQLLEDEEASPA